MINITKKTIKRLQIIIAIAGIAIITPLIISNISSPDNIAKYLLSGTAIIILALLSLNTLIGLGIKHGIINLNTTISGIAKKNETYYIELDKKLDTHRAKLLAQAAKADLDTTNQT